MKIRDIAALFALLLICISGLSQQEPMPDKLSPEAVKALREQEQRFQESVAAEGLKTAPKFGFLKCRADAQTWTSDPFDSKDARNLTANTALMVNGQFRSIPAISSHATVRDLMDRASEMAVCIREDADFEEKYKTYSALSRAFTDEYHSRYLMFVIEHNLQDQFLKEDSEKHR